MNELQMQNIGGVDYHLKDQHARDIIAPSENGLDSQSNLPVASRPYVIGEYLIDQNRLYYEVIDTISTGDVLVVGSNIKRTTVSAEINKLKGNSAVAAIEIVAPIEDALLSARPYATGAQLYWLNEHMSGLYEATTSIAIGDALVIGTNIKVADKVVESIYNIKAAINTINGNINSINGSVSTLNTQMSTANGNITAINNDMADMVNILGAKNMLPNGASTITTNGITFTVNANGTVKATGTATADAILVLSSSFYVGNGRQVILSGCPDGGSTSKYYIQMTNANGTTGKGNDVGSGVTITADADNLGCRIVIKKNQVLGTTGKTFSPMVRPVNIRNASYVPYAMTNRELSSQISNLTTPQTVTITSGYAINRNNSYSIGKLVTLNVGLAAPAGYNAGNYLEIAYSPKPAKTETAGVAIVIYGTKSFVTVAKITSLGKIFIFTTSDIFQTAGNNNCDITVSLCYVSN